MTATSAHETAPAFVAYRMRTLHLPTRRKYVGSSPCAQGASLDCAQSSHSAGIFDHNILSFNKPRFGQAFAKCGTPVLAFRQGSTPEIIEGQIPCTTLSFFSAAPSPYSGPLDLRLQVLLCLAVAPEQQPPRFLRREVIRELSRHDWRIRHAQGHFWDGWLT
jgi:hypothetical protein